MIRLFVGLALPRSICDQLHALAIGIPGARWLEPQAYHITLRFIGNVGEDVAEDIHTALAAIQAAPFTVEVTGTGAFSQGHRIHSLWAGLRRTPLLLSLRDKVERAVVQASHVAVHGNRRYAPHITLARLKGTPTARVRHFLAASNLFHAGPFQVDRFILFVSHFSRYGVSYELVADYPLIALSHKGAQ
ncbi:2'-5' RNA ligase [invertebrate metagenome]|uniref:2'-5' RNA ligase n=1 Tax=invertebrate metagenome TaxID=1711999 RepID=A0A484HBY4_9ZZZZ